MLLFFSLPRLCVPNSGSSDKYEQLSGKQLSLNCSDLSELPKFGTQILGRRLLFYKKKKTSN
jgi:hypothetical protein